MIDFQRDFVYPGGFGESLGNDTSFLLKALPPAEKVLEACRAAGMFVIHTREGHRPDLVGLPARQVDARQAQDPHRRRGARWAGCSSAASTATTSSRRSTRSTASRSWTSPARARSTPPTWTRSSRPGASSSSIVCGVTTEVCVQTSVREANDRGYDALVLEDGVGSYFPEFQKAALDMIKAQGGIFGFVGHVRGLPGGAPAGPGRGGRLMPIA